jgi:hypothetical protein
MIDVTCLCGAVRVTAPRPAFVHDCNCRLCSAAGARWGYYDPAEVTVTGETAGYVRDDKPDAGACIRFCPTCGTTTHFVLTEQMIARVGNTMLGVNLRLADPRDLASVELRYPDGRAWDGAGAFTYRREPELLG